VRLELFMMFNGNCRQAVEFYARVFRSSVEHLITYSKMPGWENYTGPESDKDLIMYSRILFENLVLMCSDVPSKMEIVKGNNLSPTVSLDDKEEITRIFNELKIGGKVLMELQQTFYSECYGYVEDQFGIQWQILHYQIQPPRDEH